MKLTIFLLFSLAVACISAPPEAINSEFDAGMDVGIDVDPLDDVGTTPDGWTFPGLANRVEVSWTRNGNYNRPFVVPLDEDKLDLPDGVSVTAALIDGEVLPVERNDKTLWIRLPSFENEGSFFVYFGDDSVLSSGDVWSDYLGVWHFGEESRLEDSSTEGANLDSPSALDYSSGLLGDGATMLDARMGAALIAPSLGVDFPSDATIEFWASADMKVQGADNVLFGGGGENYVRLAGGPEIANTQLQLRVVVEGETDRCAGRIGNYPETNDFVHVAIVFNSDPRWVAVYFNGAIGRLIFPNDPDGKIELPDAWVPSDQRLGFGGGWVGGGQLDEARVSAEAHGQDYFLAVQESYSQDFLSVGTPSRVMNSRSSYGKSSEIA